MPFRMRPGIKLPYSKQGLICFICLDYYDQNICTRRKINRLCREIGGQYADALFALVTTDASITEISRRYYVSADVLFKLRRRFYESWYA